MHFLLIEYIIYLLAFLLTIVLLAKILQEASVARLLLLGFALRLFVMMLDYCEIVQIPGNGDVDQFNTMARDNQNSSEMVYVTNYEIVLTYVYKLTRCSKLFAQYLNVIMGMFLLLYLNKVLKILFVSNKSRRLLVAIMTLMPNMVFFSAILLREAWIEMFIMLSMYFFILWFFKVTGYKDIIIAILLIFAAAWMHTGCIVLVFGYVSAFLLYNRKYHKLEFKRAIIPSLLVLPLIIFIIMGFDMGKISRFQGSSMNDFMVDVYSSDTDAGSAYLQWLNITSPIQAIAFAPLKMFYFQFSPMPFDWRSIMDIVAFLLDSCVYIFLIFNIFRYRKRIIEEKRYLALFLLLSFFVATLVFSFGTLASGTAVRHRAKICSVLIVCYGLTHSNKRQVNVIGPKNLQSL